MTDFLQKAFFSLALCLVISLALSACGQFKNSMEINDDPEGTGKTVVASPSPSPSPKVQIQFPKSSLNNTEIAVVINTQDPQSVAVGAYYIQKRKIPSVNVARVSFPVSNDMTPTAFA